MTTPILTVNGVSKRFGGVQAVTGASLAVAAGSVTGVIGPNGSGKTTLFHLISGVYRADSGKVTLRDRDITNRPAHVINRLGLGRTFQITRLFGQMTALENLLVGARTGGRDRAMELLAFVRLEQLAHEYTANLSYGQQKLVEFVRVLMTDPELIMLDEPFAGVNPLMEERLVEHMRELQAKGTSFLITDHEMRIIMSLCDHLVVLDHGEVIATGAPAAIRDNEHVIEAYFGR